MENTAKPKSRSLIITVILLAVAAAAFVLMRGTGHETEPQRPQVPQTVPAQPVTSPGSQQPSGPMAIMQSAIAAGDPSKCEGLPAEQMKVFCQVSAALKTGDTSICEKVTSTRPFPFKSPITGYSGTLSASDFCWMQAVRRTRQDLCSKVTAELTEECKKEYEALSKRGIPPQRGVPPNMGGLPKPPEAPRQSLMPNGGK